MNVLREDMYQACIAHLFLNAQFFERAQRANEELCHEKA